MAQRRPVAQWTGPLFVNVTMSTSSLSSEAPTTGHLPTKARQGCKSRIRSRVEPVFALIKKSPSGFHQRNIGMVRDANAFGLTSLLRNVVGSAKSEI